MKTILKFFFGFAVGFGLVSYAYADLGYAGPYHVEYNDSYYFKLTGLMPTVGPMNGQEMYPSIELIGTGQLSGPTNYCHATNVDGVYRLGYFTGAIALSGNAGCGGYSNNLNGAVMWKTPLTVSDVYMLNNDLYVGNYKLCFYDSLGTTSTTLTNLLNSNQNCATTLTYQGNTYNRLTFNDAGTPPDCGTPTENGSYGPYPDCTISCNGGYHLESGACVNDVYNQFQCSTKLVNTLSGAVWYNMGELPYNFDKSNTGTLWQQFTDVNTGHVTDADNIRFTLVNDIGSDMPSGSIAWSGSTTNAFLSGDGELQVRAVRDRAPLGFNTIQFGGVASGGNSVKVRYQYLNGEYHEGISYLSGSILTISTPQLSKGVFVSNLGRFRGIRVGVATQELKTFCGIAGSACGWRMVGTTNSCVPIQTDGIQLSSGSCNITSSGSVYGSGACVPGVNASGAVIPHIPVGGSSVYYNSSGAIVGIVNTSTVPDVSFYDQVFNCGFDYDNDSWYTTVAKALTCPITVVKNLFVTSYTSVKEVSDGFQKIQNAVSNISTASGVVQNDSGSGMNPIFASLKEKTDYINNNDGSYVSKMVKFVYWSMIIAVILLLIGIMVYLLKSKKG